MENREFSSEAGEDLGREGESLGQVVAFPRPCHRQAEGDAPAAPDSPPVGPMPAAIPAFTHALDAEGKLSMFWFTPILERGASFFACERHAEWSLSALPALFCAHVLAAVGEEGPEVVRFGGGEQVIPAAPSSRMLEALAANARSFAARAAAFGERFAADFGGMQGRMAAPALAAGATPNPATGLNPVGWTLAAAVNVGGIKVEVTAAETGGMSPEALGDLVAKRVKGEMAGVAEGVFAKEIRRATRHFTEQE